MNQKNKAMKKRFLKVLSVLLVSVFIIPAFIILSSIWIITGSDKPKAIVDMYGNWLYNG